VLDSPVAGKREGGGWNVVKDSAQGREAIAGDHPEGDQAREKPQALDAFLTTDYTNFTD
jgi:hypothetical protein